MKSHELPSSALVPAIVWAPFMIRTYSIPPQPQGEVMVPVSTRKLTRCPAVAVKEKDAFCPGAVVVTLTGAPPGVIEPDTSAGTSYSCSDRLPVFPCGSIVIVYVPLADRVTGS